MSKGQPGKRGERHRLMARWLGHLYILLAAAVLGLIGGTWLSPKGDDAAALSDSGPTKPSECPPLEGDNLSSSARESIARARLEMLLGHRDRAQRQLARALQSVLALEDALDVAKHQELVQALVAAQNTLKTASGGENETLAHVDRILLDVLPRSH